MTQITTGILTACFASLRMTAEIGHCEPAQAGVAIPILIKKGDLMNYYVYILSNSHKTVIYTGVTNDLIRRVYEHKNHVDKNSFTSQYNVENLVYFEVTNNPEAAIAREKQIKSWNRKRKDEF